MTTTLATEKQSAAIRARMQAIRTDLPYGADAARARVQELTDWKYHMRKHPWPILAATAAVSYLLVPADRQERIVIHSDTTDPKTAETAPKKSMAGGIVGALATLAVKQGTGILTRKLSASLFDSTPASNSNRNGFNDSEVHVS